MVSLTTLWPYQSAVKRKSENAYYKATKNQNMSKMLIQQLKTYIGIFTKLIGRHEVFRECNLDSFLLGF